jgi:hypothetical protein
MRMHFSGIKSMPTVKALAPACGYEGLKFTGLQDARVIATPFADQFSFSGGSPS